MKATLVCVIAAVLLQGYTVYGQDQLVLSSSAEAAEGTGPWFLTISTANGQPAANDIDIRLQVLVDPENDVIPSEEDVTITLFGGQSSVQHDYTILDNSIIQDERRFVVEASILDPTLAEFVVGGGTQSRDSAVVTILDDDVVIVEITAIDGSEDTQTATVTLRIAAGSAVVPASGFSVQLISAPGSASVDDYNPISVPNPVQFLPGDGPLTTRSATFTITDDNIVELQESFSVTGTVSASFVTFSNGLNSDTVTVNIADNDRVVVAFVPATYNVREDEGPVSVCVEIIMKSLAPGLGATVSIDSDDGTAMRPGDYPQVVSRVLNFPPGSGIGAQVCTPIAVVDDGINEADIENFFLDLSPGSNSDIGTPSRATINIIDTSVIVEISASAGSEDAPQTATITLRIAAGSAVVPAPGFSVQLTSAPGSASVDDYNPIPVPNPVQFLPGDGPLTTRSATFTIIDDNIVELQESFSVTGTVSASFVTFSNGLNSDTATVNIADNDRVEVAFVPSTYTVREDEGPVSVCVQIIMKSLAPGLGTTVSINSADGTAIQPGDYPQVVSRVLNFPPGSGIGAQVCTPIAVVDDGINEATDIENFFLDLSPGTNSGIGSPSRATINIIDATLICSFSQANYEVVEGNTAQLVVTLTGQPSSRDVVKLLNCQGVSATSGADFTPVTSLAVTFPAGSTAPQTVTIATTQDGLRETDETFTCTLADSPNPPVVTIGNIGQATVTIRDNDVPQIGFEFPSYTIGENQGPETVCVEIRNGVQLDPSFTVTLSLTSSACSNAQVGSDYNPATGEPVNLEFNSINDGDQLCVQFEIINDLIPESNEFFCVGITSTDPATLNPDATTVTIIDDDDDFCVPDPCDVNAVCASTTTGFTCTCNLPYIDTGSGLPGDCVIPVTIGWQMLTYSGPEGSSIIAVAQITGGLANIGTRTFTLSYVCGSIQAGTSDYTCPSGTLTFSVNQVTDSVTIPLLTDNIEELSETFDIVLSDPTSPPRSDLIINPPRTVCTITDTTVPQIGFEFPSYTIGEDQGPELVCVEINNGVQLDPAVTITLSLTSSACSNAQVGSDYNLAAGEPVNLQFTSINDDDELCVQFQIINDNNPESNEFFCVDITTTDPVILNPDDTTVTIIDDDDFCVPDPCDVNAVCTSTTTGFTCTCNPPYLDFGSGLPGDCQNLCDPSPCDVNAVCTFDTSGFTCTCNPPYLNFGSGLPGDCQNLCDPSPCDINAMCTFDINGFTCTCNPPYIDMGAGLPGDCQESDTELQFTLDTPRLTWSGAVEFQAELDVVFSRPTNVPNPLYVCTISPIPFGPPIRHSCDTGSFTATGLGAGSYRITVRLIDLDTRETMTIQRRIRIPTDVDNCEPYLINAGVTIDGQSAIVEWSSTGDPTGFWCKLDREARFQCSSPVHLMGLGTGRHVVRIRSQCPAGRNRNRAVRFTV